MPLGFHFLDELVGHELEGRLRGELGLETSKALLFDGVDPILQIGPAGIPLLTCLLQGDVREAAEGQLSLYTGDPITKTPEQRPDGWTKT